jgi:uncharacterized protein (TIGR02444 family)
MSAASSNKPDQGIWDWVLAAYERPGVPQACLDLQDAHGQNTSFLLWAVWAGVDDAARLAAAAEAARGWDDLALQPLRAIRRALKPSHPPVADADREGLREMVKAAELRAERVLVETLGALGPRSPTPASARAALKAASVAWGGPPAPEAALAALATGLE